MVCRTTTAFVMLVLLSTTQAARSAEPLNHQLQPSIVTLRSQKDRVRITTPTNSLKFVINDPASRSLVGPATEQRRTIQPVNHEYFTVTPEQERILVSQLGEEKARDALDALRPATEDLDLPDTSAERVDDRSPIARPPAVRDTRPVPRDAVIDSLKDEEARREQRKRELQSILESVNKRDGQDTKKSLDLDLDDNAEDKDDESESDEDSTDDYKSDYRPATPEPIYNKNSNYEDIPWTISNLFEDPKKYDRQCREQEFCRLMWECAGGKDLSPSERRKREARRTYELMFGSSPRSNPMPLMSGFIIEPMLGYGFFGAPMRGAGGCGAGGCGAGGCGAGGCGGSCTGTGGVVHRPLSSAGCSHCNHSHHCGCSG